MVHHKGVQADLKFEVVEHVVPLDATHCLRCGYHNLMGYSQDDIKGKVQATVVPVVNGVLTPLGWQYISVGVYGDYFEIYYKEASPAEPITTATVITILTLITILILGLVVAWVAWVYLETGKMKAQAKADKKKLLDEGKITSEQYKELIEAQAEEEDMFKTIGDILPLILVFIIIMVIAGAVGKRRD